PASLTATQGVAQTFGLGSYTDNTGNGGPWTVNVNWGDGESSQFTLNAQGAISASHGFASTGSFNGVVTVTNAGGQSGKAFVTFTVSAPTTPTSYTAPFIVTPYDKIPNFGAHPTVASARSGTWSDPTTWSTGVVPGAGDVVSVEPGTTVTYDAVS